MQTSRSDHDPRHARETARFLAERLAQKPRAAILAGTGLGDIADTLTVQEAFEYGRLPHFPLATVQSHAGRWVAGTAAGVPVAVLQGRFHLYEGYDARAVTFPIRVLQALGVATVLITNAAGGLNPSFAAGDIMIIRDHINLTGGNPLVGVNEEQWGPRFPDMTAAYHPELSAIALDEARAATIPVRQGVYVGLRGPSLETPAEMRFLRTAGADAVGFSTVMETIAAVHGGMRVLGLSIITNLCAPDKAQPADVADIIAVARSAAPRLGTLINAVLARLGETESPRGQGD